jgi:hypothetical protein
MGHLNHLGTMLQARDDHGDSADNDHQENPEGDRFTAHSSSGVPARDSLDQGSSPIVSG